MHDIQILQQHPRKVLESLNRGAIEGMELAVEQITVRVFHLQFGKVINRRRFENVD